MQIDREKAKAIGVPISQVTQALGVYMGSQYVNDFDFNNRSYRVYVQADQPFRMTARDLREYYVRSDTSGLVPLGNIVSLKETSGPQVINHYDLFRSAEIDGAAAPGYSSSQGLKAMEGLAKQNMVQGMSFQWTGLALEEVEAGGKEIEEKPRKAPKPTKVIDLVSVLQKSLEQSGVKEKSKGKSRAKKAHPTRKAA